MSKSHVGIYGAVRLNREYCGYCKIWAFVFDGKVSCCDKLSKKEELRKYKVMSIPQGKRHRPSVKIQERILKKQDNKCLYCEKPFNTPYVRNRKVLFTKLHFDHLIPFSYSLTNSEFNFVAACNICNGIKSNKCFESVEDVYRYVDYHRRKRGVKYHEDLENLEK